MSTIYDWSLKAADNTRADDLIDWSEGQRPSTINNSARGMMQRVREYLSDTGGALEGVVTVHHIMHKNTIKSIGFMQLFYMNPLKNPHFYT